MKSGDDKTRPILGWDKLKQRLIRAEAETGLLAYLRDVEQLSLHILPVANLLRLNVVTASRESHRRKNPNASLSLTRCLLAGSRGVSSTLITDDSWGAPPLADPVNSSCIETLPLAT